MDAIIEYAASQPPVWFLLIIVVTAICVAFAWLLRFVLNDFTTLRTRSNERIMKMAEAMRSVAASIKEFAARLEKLERAVEHWLDRDRHGR